MNLLSSITGILGDLGRGSKSETAPADTFNPTKKKLITVGVFVAGALVAGIATSCVNWRSRKKKNRNATQAVREPIKPVLDITV